MGIFFRRLVAGAMAVVVLAACSSGDGGEGGGRAGGGDGGGSDDGEQAIVLAVTETRVESMAVSPGPFPEDVWSNVYDVLNAYLDRALVRPLRSGQPPTALEPLFSAPALERATTVDRAAMLEEGTTLSGTVTSPRTHALLVLLTDRGGGPVVVNATVDLVLFVAPEGGGSVEVTRTGQVALVHDGAGWVIDSYDLRVARDSR